MYLSDYQKNLVRRLNKEGQYGIYQDLEDFLVSREVSFTWDSGTHNPKVPSEYRNYFIYSFKANNPQAYADVEFSYKPERLASSQAQLMASIPQFDINLRSERYNLDKKEYKDQQKLLYEFQGKLEESICLIQILQENNLVISYETDIEESFQFGEQLEVSDNERVVAWRMYNQIDCLQNRLADSLEKFLRKQLIVLPSLKEFETNNYKTYQELDRQLELKQLKGQTKILFAGILVSALVTLIPTLRECHLAEHERIEIEYPGELLILQTDEKQFQVGAN